MQRCWFSWNIILALRAINYGRLDELTVPSDWSSPNSGDVPAPVIALVVNADADEDLIINDDSDGEHDSETDSD